MKFKNQRKVQKTIANRTLRRPQGLQTRASEFASDATSTFDHAAPESVFDRVTGPYGVDEET